MLEVLEVLQVKAVHLEHLSFSVTPGIQNVVYLMYRVICVNEEDW